MFMERWQEEMSKFTHDSVMTIAHGLAQGKPIFGVEEEDSSAPKTMQWQAKRGTSRTWTLGLGIHSA